MYASIVLRAVLVGTTSWDGDTNGRERNLIHELRVNQPAWQLLPIRNSVDCLPDGLLGPLRPQVPFTQPLVPEDSGTVGFSDFWKGLECLGRDARDGLQELQSRLVNALPL